MFIQIAIHAQNKGEIIPDSVNLSQLKRDVEKNMNNLDAHAAYIQAMGIENQQVEKQYQTWMQHYPNTANIPFAFGKAYSKINPLKAKPYLLRATDIQPSFKKAWELLLSNARALNNYLDQQTYLAQLIKLEPSNLKYAYNYAFSFINTDYQKAEELSLSLIKQFPNNEFSEQALYKLAENTNEKAKKINYFEQLYNQYPPLESGWSYAAMFPYFSELLTNNTAKAEKIAAEMAQIENDDKKYWIEHLKLAKAMHLASTLINEKKYDQALVQLNHATDPDNIENELSIVLLKAKAQAAVGKINQAYDSLLYAFKTKPSIRLKDALNRYGSSLNKNNKQIELDIKTQIYKDAPFASPFINLNSYSKSEKASLSDFQGKVVLLTYWFPTCTPCREEFPSFENVVKKFDKKELEYLAINIDLKQANRVLPFTESTRYSFTALEDIDGREKGNLDNFGRVPKNFLIDKNGRLLFSNFRINKNNEADLELMINLLKN
ncbi:redoxin domain-containing protein [Pedobacter sp. MW01-1-1]|uniref:redoxin domain-containing protein n=1 Tax=Pedobacter sp. MW01-1-1 TaxID=3383027 RepID=UPI003FEFEB00